MGEIEKKYRMIEVRKKAGKTNFILESMRKTEKNGRMKNKSRIM